MKLMKKNSSVVQQPKQKPSSLVKFDWSKITDRNSSVRSE